MEIFWTIIITAAIVGTYLLIAIPIGIADMTIKVLGMDGYEKPKQTFRDKLREFNEDCKFIFSDTTKWPKDWRMKMEEKDIKYRLKMERKRLKKGKVK